MKPLTYVRVATFIVLLSEVLVGGGRVTARYGPYSLAASESEREPDVKGDQRKPDVHGGQRVLLKDSNGDLFTELQLLNRTITTGSAASEMVNPNSSGSNVTLTPVETTNLRDEIQVVQPLEANLEVRSGVFESEKSINLSRQASHAEENDHKQQQDSIIRELMDNLGQVQTAAEDQQLQRKIVEARQTPTREESSDELRQQEQTVHIPGREEIQNLQKLNFPLKGEITNKQQFQENLQISIAKIVERQCSLALRQVSSMCRCSQVGKPTWIARAKRETILNSTDDITGKETRLESRHFEVNVDRHAVTRRRKHEGDTFFEQMMASERPRRINRSGVENNTKMEKEEPIIVPLRLDCSCNGDQVLELTGISALPPSVHQLHVSDCRGGEVVLSPSLTASDSSLRHLTLTNIKRLTLGGGALDMNLISDGQETQFLMELRNIGQLKISRGAIRLSGPNCNSSFVWKNVILGSLPSFAITASNLVNFTLNGILIEGTVETASLNLESSGTYLTLDEVDAREGIWSNWISGDLAGLSITRSRMNLAPGAFQQVSFSQGNPNVIIRNNIFGDQRWSSSMLHPSLASGVFDFTFKDDSAIFNISRNTAECSRSNLEWLYEHKKSVILHWLRCGILKTLSCHDNDQQPPSQPTCRFQDIIPTVPAEKETSTAAIVKSGQQTPVTEIDTYREDQERKENNTKNRKVADILFLYPSELHSISIYAAGSKYPTILSNLTNSKRNLRDGIQSFKEQQPRDGHDDLHGHSGQTNVYQQKRNTEDVEQDSPYRLSAEEEDLGLDLHREVNTIWQQRSVVALERLSLPKERQMTSSGGSHGTVINEMGLFMTSLMILHIYRVIIHK